MRHCHRAVLLVVLALLAVAAPALAADHTVQITATGGFTFSPATLTVAVGDRVAWRNRQSIQHTATSGVGCTGNGIFDTGFINPNVTTAFITFNTAGTYPYVCIVHCGAPMTGTIIVQGPVSVQNKTWGAVKALFKPKLEALED